MMTKRNFEAIAEALKSAHTAGPWHVETGVAFPGQPANIVNGDGWAIASRLGRDDAARIVACVNACEGMLADELADGVVPKRIAVGNDRARRDELAALRAQRGELAAALAATLPALIRLGDFVGNVDEGIDRCTLILAVRAALAKIDSK